MAALTPQQKYELDRYLRGVNARGPGTSRDLTYEEWLIATGRVPPPGARPPSARPQADYGQMMSKLPEAVGVEEGLSNLFGGGASELSPEAIQALAQGDIAGLEFNAAADAATAAANASPFSLGGIGAAGNVILPGAGVLGGLDVLRNDRGPLRGTLQGAGSGAAIGSYFGPAGIVPGAVIGGGIGLVKGLTEHESTRDVAKRHSKELASKFPDDPTYQAYVRGMREQHNSAPADPSKPYHGGQYSSFDEYKRAGLDPTDLTGVYGNIKAFGKDWSDLSFDEQVAVTQGLIDADQYYSSKGDVKLKDEKKAQEIFANIRAGGFKIPKVDSKVSSGSSSSAPSKSPFISTTPNISKEELDRIGVKITSSPKIMIPKVETKEEEKKSTLPSSYKTGLSYIKSRNL